VPNKGGSLPLRINWENIKWDLCLWAHSPDLMSILLPPPGTSCTPRNGQVMVWQLLWTTKSNSNTAAAVTLSFLVILSHHLIHLAFVFQLSKPGSLALDFTSFHWIGTCGHVWPIFGISKLTNSCLMGQTCKITLWNLRKCPSFRGQFEGQEHEEGQDHSSEAVEIGPLAWDIDQFAGVNCELVLASLGQCCSCTCGTSATVPFAAKCGKECGYTDPMTLRKEYQKSNATIIYDMFVFFSL